MSRHDDGVSLRQMREHAAEAVAASVGRSRNDLDHDRMFAFAMIKIVEIVGEAAGRVSPETRRILPAVPWTDVIATRNRLTHGYDNVDYDILWNIIVDDLPSLMRLLDDEVIS